jgi:hypothetical protein
VPDEKLVVHHRIDQPSLYEYAKATQAGTPLPPLRELSPKELDMPFGGSDYTLGDLGLEFLHWPQQTRLRFLVYRSTGCDELESRRSNPDKSEYIKIISRIDRDSGVILLAEAYSQENKRVKEFYPKSYFTKRRQPKEARMTSNSGSQTTILFQSREK